MNTLIVIEEISRLEQEYAKKKKARWGVLGKIKKLGKNAVGKFGERLAFIALEERGFVVTHSHAASKDLVATKPGESTESYEVKTSAPNGASFWFNQIHFGPAIDSTPWRYLVFVFISRRRFEIWVAERSKELKASFIENNGLMWRGQPKNLDKSLWTKLAEWDQVKETDET